MDIEKRKFPRADLFQQSYCVLEKGNDDPEILRCIINNISVTGIAFEIGDGYIGFDEKTKSVYIIYKIDGNVHNVKCAIRNVNNKSSKMRLGCQFLKDDRRRSSIINNYVMQYRAG